MNINLLLELTHRYTETHRHYHNLTHIATMFEVLKKLENFQLSTTQTLAIWFHDVVYDPLFKNNEERSCEFARSWLTDKIDKEDLEKLCKIIMDTKTHVASCKESELVIDLDYASFAENWKDNAFKVSQEYVSCIGIEDFRKGRIQFLENLLKKEKFFYLERFNLLYTDHLIQDATQELKRQKE